MLSCVLAGLRNLSVGYGKELLHFQVSADLSQTHALSVIGLNQR